MDAQHTSLFGHTPVLSVSDMRLPLPCSDDLFECSSAFRWAFLSSRTPKPRQFLPALKALVGEQLIVTREVSGFGEFILLHGLLSLTTHLHAGGSTALKLGNSSENGAQGEDWKYTMSIATETWSFSLLSLQPSLCLEAAQSLHRMTYIVFYTNTTELHIIARNCSEIDNLLQRKEAEKAEKRLRARGQGEEAKQAARHSLLMVKETLFTGKRYIARGDNIAWRPRCLYYAILVLWAYGVVMANADALAVDCNRLIGAEEYVIRMLSALQGEMGGVSVVASKTAGLVMAAARALEGCRWALLNEA